MKRRESRFIEYLLILQNGSGSLEHSKESRKGLSSGKEMEIGKRNSLIYQDYPKRCINIPMDRRRHSRESGNPERHPGFRVKPGMTDAQDPKSDIRPAFAMAPGVGEGQRL
jgi:hypothetical protein